MVIDGTDTAIFPFISVQIEPKNERAKIKMFAKKCKIERELYCKKKLMYQFLSFEDCFGKSFIIIVKVRHIQHNS